MVVRSTMEIVGCKSQIHKTIYSPLFKFARCIARLLLWPGYLRWQWSVLNPPTKCDEPNTSTSGYHVCVHDACYLCTDSDLEWINQMAKICQLQGDLNSQMWIFSLVCFPSSRGDKRCPQHFEKITVTVGDEIPTSNWMTIFENLLWNVPCQGVPFPIQSRQNKA